MSGRQALLELLSKLVDFFVEPVDLDVCFVTDLIHALVGLVQARLRYKAGIRGETWMQHSTSW